MPNANSFIADELVHKNKYLYIALNQAKDIIKTLESENQRMKNVLEQLIEKEKEKEKSMAHAA